MRDCCRVFLAMAEELMHEYLHRIKKQVRGEGGMINGREDAREDIRLP